MPKPLFITNTARGGSGVIARMLNASKQVNIASEAYLDLFRSLRNRIVKNSDDPELSSLVLDQEPFYDYYFSPNHLKIFHCIQNCSCIDIKFEKNEWKRMLGPLVERGYLENKELVPYFAKTCSDTYLGSIQKALENIPIARNINASTLKWVGIKDAWIIELFLPLAKSFPDAKFIIILRDPRSSISSNQRVADQTRVAHVQSFAKSWRKHLAFTIHYQNHPLFRDRLYVIQYEQFVREPDKKAKELCNFLDLTFDKSMLETDNYFDYSSGETWKGNSNYRDVMKGIRSDHTDRWRASLPEEIIKTIELVCDPDIRLLGLEPLFSTEVIWKEPDILEFLLRDTEGNKAWQNIFGRLEMDYGFELFRKTLITSAKKNFDSNLIERAFLFEEVFNLLRKTPVTPIF
tara:strand:- start:1619 stop:2830 length:1212 start_codon:yes stop_codon:yes gene_type:complete